MPFWCFPLKKMPDIYDALLTGAADSLNDFVYIIKSYNGIHYSGLTSHLNFQFPRQESDVQAIIDRPGGEILLRKNGLELFRGIPVTFNFYNGASSKTFSISASFVKTEIVHNTISLPIEKIDHDYDGIRRFKIPGHHNFKPLDSLLYNNETIQIDQVTVNIKSGETYLSLREA